MNTKEFEKLLGKKAPLHRELRKYLETDTGTFPMLRHPLVTTFYSESMNAMYNEQLKQKKEYLRKTVREKNWSHVMFLHERPYRFDAFLKYCDRMDLPVAADLLFDVWTDTEFPYQNQKAWLDEFRYYHACSPVAVASKLNLPEGVFPVYRGACAEEAATRNYGLSWTIDKGIAEWFAKRWSKKGVVMTKLATRDSVFAYLTDRNEAEVVLDPENLL